MRLLLAEPELHARPGGAPIEALLSLTNTGSAVDRPTITLEGLEPAWYRLTSSHPALAPGEEAEIRLEIQVPEGAGAGPRPFRVTTAKSTVEAILHVAPAARVEMELVPRLRRSRHSAEYAVHLRNTGNVDQILRLTSDGSGESMRVEIWPDEVLVAAGSEVWGRARVAPARRSFTGRPRAYLFWLTAQPAEDDSASPLTQTAGQLHVSPPFAFIPVIYDAVTRHVPIVLISLVGLGLLAWFRAPAMERAAAPLPTAVAVVSPSVPASPLPPLAAPPSGGDAPVAAPDTPPPGSSPVGAPLDPLANAPAAALAETFAAATPAGAAGPGGAASPGGAAGPATTAGPGESSPALQGPSSAMLASPTPQRILITLGVPGGGAVQVPVPLHGSVADLRVEPRDLTTDPPLAPGIERFEYSVTSGGAETVLTTYVLRPSAGGAAGVPAPAGAPATDPSR